MNLLIEHFAQKKDGRMDQCGQKVKMSLSLFVFFYRQSLSFSIVCLFLKAMSPVDRCCLLVDLPISLSFHCSY